GASYLCHALTLVLAAFGIALWRRCRQPLAACVGAFLLYQLALYAGLHVMQRYLFQMFPFLCAFGSSLVVLRGNEDGGVLAPTPTRLVLGAGLAVVLLGLAFLGPLLDGNCT